MVASNPACPRRRELPNQSGRPVSVSSAPVRPIRRPAFNIVPGDGIQVIYEELLGVNRARYFALTQQQFTAREADRLGLLNEVLANNAVYTRAMELAGHAVRHTSRGYQRGSGES